MDNGGNAVLTTTPETAILASDPTDDGIDALAKVMDKAAQGDESTVPIIRNALTKNPKIVDLLGGNVAKIAQDSFVCALSGKDLVFRESLIAKLQALRDELNGQNPSAVERLLVERVVACWLQVQDADIRYAQAKGATFEQSNFDLRRMNGAHKRYLSALKTLAAVRKMALPAIQINIARKQVNQLNTTACPNESKSPKD
jgi:hypothetical protein